MPQTTAPLASLSRLQQNRSPARTAVWRALRLPVEQIHPQIRIAHRLTEPLEIPERIIFDHELVLVLAGGGGFVSAGRRTQYHPHDLLLIRPFVPHAFTAPTGETAGHIAVHFDFARGVPDWAASETPEQPYQVQLTQGLSLPAQLSLSPGHRIETSLLALLREWERDDPVAPMAASHHLSAVLIDLLRAGTARTGSVFAAQNDVRIEALIAYIKQRPAETFRAEQLAQVAGLSVSRMNSLFRQRTGYSPMEYVQRARVEEARRLLADLRFSLKEIAARTGFHDQFHFSKCFRRIDGLSPQHYREALLAGRRGPFPASGDSGNRCAE